MIFFPVDKRASSFYLVYPVFTSVVLLLDNCKAAMHLRSLCSPVFVNFLMEWNPLHGDLRLVAELHALTQFVVFQMDRNIIFL